MDDFHEWISWMTFMEADLSYFYLLFTDRQTDRQTLVLVKLLSRLKILKHMQFSRSWITTLCRQITTLSYVLHSNIPRWWPNFWWKMKKSDMKMPFILLIWELWMLQYSSKGTNHTGILLLYFFESFP